MVGSRRTLYFAVLALAACGSADDESVTGVPITGVPSTDHGGASSGDADSISATGMMLPQTSGDPGSEGSAGQGWTTGTGGADSQADDDPSGPSCLSFICAPDGGAADDCDPFAQDCPRDEKCVAYVSQDNPRLAGTHCVPIDRDPDAPGEPCTVRDPNEGLDTCDLGAACSNLDPEGTGTCVTTCGGTARRPTCPDPCTACVVGPPGNASLCIAPRPPTDPTCR